MQIIIKGKQLEITPRLRQQIEQKVKRLSRLLNEDTRIEVTVAEEKTRSTRERYSVQIAISNNSRPIHSEVSAANAKIALDLVLDKITAQLGRHKDRQTSNKRHHTPPLRVLSLSRSGILSSIGEEQDNGNAPEDVQATSSLEEENNSEIWSRILEIRRLPTKPMNDQEVIAQMEAQGMSFYPFFNKETSSVNVMYRLEEGGYGLLVPALE